jgi:hypothetical protein
MHEDAADGVVSRPPSLIFAPIGRANDANGLGVLTVERELGRVVQHQDERVTGCHSVARGLKVSSQNVFLANTSVREKTVCRFRVRPVLTGPGNATPDIL